MARVTLIHGPFIAVRGSTFMQLDFKRLAIKMKGGFYHYMADISLQLYDMSMKSSKSNYFCAQINSPSMQFDNIRLSMNKEDFAHDQALFVSRWQNTLPTKL